MTFGFRQLPVQPLNDFQIQPFAPCAAHRYITVAPLAQQWPDVNAFPLFSPFGQTDDDVGGLRLRPDPTR